MRGALNCLSGLEKFFPLVSLVFAFPLLLYSKDQFILSAELNGLYHFRWEVGECEPFPMGLVVHDPFGIYPFKNIACQSNSSSPPVPGMLSPHDMATLSYWGWGWPLPTLA